MANSLLIEKETGGYFGFTVSVDGIPQPKVRNVRNDAFSVGDICHFKTATGANIVMQQNINVTDITLIASGTFTFTDIDVFLNKLIEVGYYDWLTEGGGSGGANRFDELDDTFDYFGKDGQCVIVNESELKLITVPLYNYRNFTDLEDTPDVLVANKMLIVSSDGLRVELKDQPPAPEQFLNSVGFFVYDDLATRTTPLSFLSGVEKKLTNDTIGAFTNLAYPPYGVSRLWNSTTNQIDFTQLGLGDIVTLRLAIEPTTSTANQNWEIILKLGIGSSEPLNMVIFNHNTKPAGLEPQTFDIEFGIGNNNIKNFPAELYILSDGNGTITTGVFYFSVLRKNINIIDINVDANYHIAPEKITIVDNDEIAGQNSALSYASMKFKAISLWNYIKTKADARYALIADLTNYYTKTEVDTADTNTLNSAKTYADGLVIGLLDDRGNYNPTTNSNLYPTTGGSGTSGAILKGDLWSINGLGSGVSTAIGGKTVTDGDVVRALINTPGNTDANWVITENNFGYVAENLANKQDSLDADGTGKKYPTTDVLNALSTANNLSRYLDAKVVEEGNDLARIKIGQATLSINTAVTLGTMKTVNIKKYEDKFKLMAGRKYKLTGLLRPSLSNNTSFTTFCFYDESRAVYIDKDYPYNGFGNLSLNYGTSSASNNQAIEATTAVIIPEQNIYVSLKMNAITGTTTDFDVAKVYSHITIEELGIEKINVLVNIPTSFVEHAQGTVYTTDYPDVFFASITDRIVKVDIHTGAILATYSGVSHIGGICYLNGKIYAGYTPIANFNTPSPASQILEINPVGMTLIRAVNNTGINAFGCIGTDGTKLYVGYGSSSLTDGKIQEINTTTLLLTGSVTTITGAFSTGIQTIDYFNGQWYFGVHTGVASPGTGGGLIILNNSFVIQNTYIVAGDFSDGYGNGLIQYKGNIYFMQPVPVESPYTHRLRLLKL